MDKALIANKFSKSLKSYNQEAKAQKMIVKKLTALVEKQNIFDSDTILEFGSGTGLLTHEIHSKFNYNKLYLNDLSEEFEKFTLEQFMIKEKEKIQFLRGDIEQISIPKELDLIISSSTEQWVANKVSFYKKMHDSLTKNGYLIYSSFGLDNLKQLREATGVSLDYFSLEDTEKLLSDYFDIIYTEEERITLDFGSAIDILTHIKKTGVNAISKQNWTPKSVKKMITKIEMACKNNDVYSITYHPTYFILKKKELINKKD